MQHGLAQPQAPQSRLSNPGRQQPDGRAAPTGSQFVMSASHLPPEYRLCPKDRRCKLTPRSFRNISGRKLATAVSRWDPQQRLTNPHATPSTQLVQPGSSVDAGKRTGPNAAATSQRAGSSKRGRNEVESGSSSSEAPTAQAQSARL